MTDESTVEVPYDDYNDADSGMPKRPPIGSQLKAEFIEVITDYTEKAMAFRFEITEDGDWSGFQDVLMSGKAPHRSTDEKTGKERVFWPAKNYAMAVGIEAKRKGDKAVIPFGDMVGKPFIVFYGKEYGEYGEYSKAKKALPYVEVES